MPSMNHTIDIRRVKQIAIDEEGNVAKRFPRIDAEGQLKNTLLFAMHPEICVLSMQVPGGLLDAYEQARISQVLMRVRYEGRECTTEAEAIIDAFREKVNFYRVTEFQTRADIGRSGEPILRKETFRKSNTAS